MIRKVWIFHETLVFSICSSGQKDVSSAKTAESFSGKVLQDFCSKSENQNKKLVFQKKVTENFLLDTWIAVLDSTRNHSANLKKIEYSSKLCFLSEHSRRQRGSRCDNSTQCFLLEVRTWWKSGNCFIQSIFSSKCSTGDDEC